MAFDKKKARHTLLLTTISDALDPTSMEYANFVEYFKIAVPTGLLSTKKTLLAKFEALVAKDVLGPGNYIFLKEASEKSQNNEILRLIKEAEEDIRKLDNITEDLGRPYNLYFRKDNHWYYNNAGRRGLLLILNFKEKRSGTENDVKNLKAFFGLDGLNFEILDPRENEQDDLTKDQVDAALTSVQKKLNGKSTKEYYCFVCVVLSHGTKEGIVTRDHVKPINEIQESFNNRNIPNFAGRPKLFFIQACRGNVYPRGQLVSDNNDRDRENDDNCIYVDEADKETYIPTDADTLTAYATTFGNVSFRREGDGSWFIKECIDVFRKDHKIDHVEEMLITVRREVAFEYVTDGRIKQMPCVNSTLTHRLMLTKFE